MFNDEATKDKKRELTVEETYVKSEIQAFCEMNEPYEQGFDRDLSDLVRKISNVLNPNEPVVYQDAIDKLYKMHFPHVDRQ